MNRTCKGNIKLVERTANIPVAITLGIGALIGVIVGAKLIVKFKPDYIETVIRFDVLVCIAEIYFYIF
jgi:uncharacterized membrane protein YfcA